MKLSNSRALLARWNPDAAVVHRKHQLDFVAGLADHFLLQPHLAPLGELDRIAEQIRQHLPQPARIADGRLGQPGADGRNEFQSLGARLRANSEAVSAITDGSEKST